jgi:RCC1 and BTB domain-containing protein
LNSIRESTNGNPKIDEIEIKEYSYDVYYAFLKYLYTDCIDIKPEVAVDLLVLAKSYSEEDLKQECIKILKNSINVENFCILFSKSIKYELVELEDFCFQFAFKNLNKICATQAFEEMDINSSKKFMKKVAEKRAFK